VIANRVRTSVPAHRDDLVAEMDASLGPDLARKVLRTWEEERVLARRDRAALGRLRRRLEGAPMIEVPRLDDDVHDLDGLALLDEHLFRARRRQRSDRR
jgi:hypothetical protein